MEPRVAVIIPCYNYGKYIGETVDSVLASTYKNIEIIIVDDGSTDEYTIHVLKEMQKLNHIRVIRRVNGGLSAARNTGIKQTEAPYVLPLDADDLIEPTFIEKGVWLLENKPSISFVYPLVKLFGAQNKVWETLPYNFAYLKFRNFIPATIIMRRKAWQVVDGYDESMRGGYEDWEFLLRLGQNGFVGLHLNEILFFYRKHEGSMLEGSNKRHKQLVRQIRMKNPHIFKARQLQFLNFLALEATRRLKQVIKKSLVTSWLSLPVKFREQIKDLMFKVTPIDAPLQRTNNTGSGQFRAMSDPTKHIDKPCVMIILPWLHVGGVEKVFLQIIAVLHAKYDFILITTKSTFEQPWDDKFRPYVKAIYHIGSFVASDDERLTFLLYLLGKYQIQIVHLSNSQFAYRALPVIREVYPKIKTMDTLHMEEPWSAWDYCSFSRNFKEFLDIRVTLTESQKRSLQSLQNYDHQHNRISVIPNGIEPLENPFPYESKQDLPFTVAYIGRLVAQKQPILFLQTARYCKQKGMPFKFLLVGDGELKKHVVTYVRKWNLENYVEVWGFSENVYEIFNRIHVFCMPSLREGLPMIGLEAMSAGVPLVVTNVPGWNDLVRDRIDGLLCSSDPENLGDACIRLFEDEELYKGISNNSRRNISTNFNLENMTREYAARYERLIKGKHSERKE